MDILGTEDIEDKLENVKEKLDRVIALLEQLTQLQRAPNVLAAPRPVKVPESKPMLVSKDDIGALLVAIDDSNLDEVSLEFVKKMRGKHAQYKDKLFVTEKQLSWLKKLAGEEF